MGISHDAGYAPFLDQTLSDNNLRQRVTILKGVPLVQELEVLNFNVIDFTKDIFRSTKLVDRANNGQANNGQAKNGLPSPPLVKTQPALTPATSHASVSPPPGAPDSGSWAKVTRKATPPPQLTLPLPSKQTKNRSNKPALLQSTWEPGPRGLDESINVNVSQQAIDDIKLRSNEKKLCNNHYLRGPCTRRDECPFIHTAKPTKEQLNALALLSRQNPCTRGQECDVENCIYGHHVSPAYFCILCLIYTLHSLTCVLASAQMLSMGHACALIAGSQRVGIHQVPNLPTRTSSTTSMKSRRILRYDIEGASHTINTRRSCKN